MLRRLVVALVAAALLVAPGAAFASKGKAVRHHYAVGQKCMVKDAKLYKAAGFKCVKGKLAKTKKTTKK